MKLSANGYTWWAAALVAVAGLLNAAADELDLLETLRPSAHQAVAEFGQIDAARKKELQE